MYNTNAIVEYSTDEEYRESIKMAFNTNLSDEDFLFDNTIIKNELDDIYEKTKDNNLFKNIYKNAAYIFFSTDEDIGLAVMFSFSHFKLFHLLLCDFLRDNTIDNTNEHYINILNSFKNKI